MTNSYKPTIKNRIAVPRSIRGVFKKPKLKYPEIDKLKVEQSVAYPVKNAKEVERIRFTIQNRKDNNRDYITRTTIERGRVMLRIWRTV